MPVIHAAGAAIPITARQVSVLTYNVLLPNSKDGWWIYKYYKGGTPEEVTTWAYRRDLLKSQLLGADADVICLQECSDLSFDDDFDFLFAAGYAAELLQKGRMRSATFWKKDRLHMMWSKQTDRVLSSAFTTAAPADAPVEVDLVKGNKPGDGVPEKPLLYVVNGHLAAGPAGPRRMRQVHDAIDAVRKHAKPAANATVPTVVCGDFNDEGDATAVHELLTKGVVTPDFKDPDLPEGEKITSKAKKNQLGRFVDAYVEAYGAEAGGGQEGTATAAAPPTMIVAQLDSRMLPSAADGDGACVSNALRERVRVMFDKFAVDGAIAKEGREAWLTAINGRVGRGSEFRAAEAILAKKKEAAGGDDAGKDEVLTFEDFLSIYTAEVREGKFWGVEHDLHACTGQGLREAGSAPFCASYDHIYYTPGALRCDGVVAPLTDAQRARLLDERVDILPCEWHPSDHLPLRAVFTLPGGEDDQ